MTLPEPPKAGTVCVDQALLLGACCTALVTLVPVALFQLGAIAKLPDPPSSVFDSRRITMSKEAHPLGIPDGLLGLASFGTTFALILLARRSKRAETLLGAKLGLDAAVAAFNASRQVIQFGKLCSLCTGTAVSAGVMAYAGRGAMQAACTTGIDAVSNLCKTHNTLEKAGNS